jgi:hypothetical protein
MHLSVLFQPSRELLKPLPGGITAAQGIIRVIVSHPNLKETDSRTGYFQEAAPAGCISKQLLRQTAAE